MNYRNKRQKRLERIANEVNPKTQNLDVEFDILMAQIDNLNTDNYLGDRFWMFFNKIKQERIWSF